MAGDPVSRDARAIASRARRVCAGVIDACVAFFVLDLVRLNLLESVPVFSLNIWMGSIGLVAVCWLVFMRGRWLPSPGYHLLRLERRADMIGPTNVAICEMPNSHSRSKVGWGSIAISVLSILVWAAVVVK